MQEQYILAIDQGTSGTKTVIFNARGEIVAKAVAGVNSSFPQPGFVEQAPAEIYQSVLASVKDCVQKFQADVSTNLASLTTCGISNQRETFLLWDQAGTPLCNALVWQCKRSVAICDRLQAAGTDDPWHIAL